MPPERRETRATFPLPAAGRRHLVAVQTSRMYLKRNVGCDGHDESEQHEQHPRTTAAVLDEKPLATATMPSCAGGGPSVADPGPSARATGPTWPAVSARSGRPNPSARRVAALCPR